MAPLADTAGELDFLAEIEALTSARQTGELPVPDGIHPLELQNERHGYGWTYVNAAFCYTRADGGRFNGPERGAWYAAYGEDAAATTRAEVTFHLTRELEATGCFENITFYRELLAGFTTRFHDLSGCKEEAFLAADPHQAYPAGQALAREVLAADGNGVLYPSARRPGGKCLAAFRPNLVQNIRQGRTWVFEWQGVPVPLISER
ncbi:RES family NAD+ phosphorylase [Labrenzia suaedae]|uniref:RES family NAD+ phosphorylase n=2 Tax=Roseibium litorale TaxID=2803841 RepID=A0ABR9CIU6_9HYPH|nr:RES family NAD+ phosphorylase [Roseibium litorale]